MWCTKVRRGHELRTYIHDYTKIRDRPTYGRCVCLSRYLLWFQNRFESHRNANNFFSCVCQFLRRVSTIDIYPYLCFWCFGMNLWCEKIDDHRVHCWNVNEFISMGISNQFITSILRHLVVNFMREWEKTLRNIPFPFWAIVQFVLLSSIQVERSHKYWYHLPVCHMWAMLSSICVFCLNIYAIFRSLNMCYALFNNLTYASKRWCVNYLDMWLHNQNQIINIDFN